jgi:uncharacterized repeat protein (TIGR04138 family)
MNFEEAIKLCCLKDQRYSPQSYHLVRMALDLAQKQVHGEEKKSGKKANRHVTGKQLLEGFRSHALETYGPLSFALLNNWGIKKSVDVGNIVFNIIDTGLFGRSPEDKIEDFTNIYDFKETFLKPFEPKEKHSKP